MTRSRVRSNIHQVYLCVGPRIGIRRMSRSGAGSHHDHDTDPPRHRTDRARRGRPHRDRRARELVGHRGPRRRAAPRAPPTADVLTPEQRLGSPDTYRDHTLHGEPDGSFSIIALVWRPGQVTRIHDHVTWCAFAVIQGVEHEDLYDADLNPIGQNDNHVGEVSAFAPPGDIHRVHNTGDTTAISIHVYGTDITRIGSSVRRYYD